MDRPGHDRHGHRRRSAAFGLLTVSDTRTEADDGSGRAMRRLVEAAGHRVHAQAIVPDEPEAIRARIAAWASDPGCDAILASGGTGIAPRDRTVEAAEPLFDLTLPGFGELFRRLSYEAVGTAAIMSRATAGIVRGTPVFLLPGAPEAVEVALGRLVLPEIAHLLGELERGGPAQF